MRIPISAIPIPGHKRRLARFDRLRQLETELANLRHSHEAQGILILNMAKRMHANGVSIAELASPIYAEGHA